MRETDSRDTKGPNGRHTRRVKEDKDRVRETDSRDTKGPNGRHTRRDTEDQEDGVRGIERNEGLLLLLSSNIITYIGHCVTSTDAQSLIKGNQIPFHITHIACSTHKYGVSRHPTLA